MLAFAHEEGKKKVLPHPFPYSSRDKEGGVKVTIWPGEKEPTNFPSAKGRREKARDGNGLPKRIFIRRQRKRDWKNACFFCAWFFCKKKKEKGENDRSEEKKIKKGAEAIPTKAEQGGGTDPSSFQIQKNQKGRRSGGAECSPQQPHERRGEGGNPLSLAIRKKRRGGDRISCHRIELMGGKKKEDPIAR